MRVALITALVVAFRATLVIGADPSSISLDFDSPTPRTIGDKNGLGCGFTRRLPGTGGAIAANDANLDLQSSPGHLLLTSARANFNQSPGPKGNNLPKLDAPGILVKGVGSADISVKALFKNVSLPNGSDHLMVYAGVNENLVITGGVHQTNVYLISKNKGEGDINTGTPPNSFSSGDDIEVSLSRRAGIWTLSWSNLTASTTGSISGVEFSEINSHADLYFGVLASNAGSDQPFVAQIDKWSVSVASTVHLAPAQNANSEIVALHRGLTDPTQEGWKRIRAFSNVRTYPVANDLETGIDAWSLNDESSGDGIYGIALTPMQRARARELGWRFAIRLRVVESQLGHNSDAIMATALGFGMQFGLTQSGEPIVRLLEGEDSGRVIEVDDAKNRYHLWPAPNSCTTCYESTGWVRPLGCWSGEVA